jgi:hypothetical protein
VKKIVIAIGGLLALVFGLVPLSFSSQLSLSPLEENPLTGIPYLSGGVGLAERETLRAMGTEDKLKLIVALNRGNSLSEVDVRVTDAAGHKILPVISQGPWFFTRLPAGQYTVMATEMRETLQQGVHLASEGQTHLHFTWNGSTLENRDHPRAEKCAIPR